LNLSRISHEHLAKLEALACIVRDPQQFDVTLREPDPSQSLVALPIDRALDFELIARLSGLSMGRLRSLNAGWLRQRIGAGGGVLLLPLAHAEKFGAAYAQLPPSLRADFVFAKLHSTMHWSDIAGNSGAPAPLLADINGRKSDAPAPAGARLYLPALLLAAIPATAEPVVVAHDRTERPASYRVRAGDSLWTIAKRFELRVGQLCEWNALSPKATLRLGQEIALGPGR
jgi:membrane-bound lytic murein transglycosylase D